MDAKLSKFSDRDIAQMMGSLNYGDARMSARLLCEASYRLVRAGGNAMTEAEDELIEEIMTCNYRLRQKMREQRRQHSNRDKGMRVPEPQARRQKMATSGLRLVK